MAASVEIPFIHPGLLAAAVAAGVAAAYALPERRWRGWAVPGLGLAAALVLGLTGILPWTGQLTLAAHAGCMAAGFLVGGMMLHRRRPPGMDTAQVVDVAMVAMVGGVVGARARFVWERWDQFALDAHGHPRSWDQVIALAADLDGGGAVWYGGLILGAIAVILYTRWRRIALLPFLDVVAPAILVGLAFGRVGCFFNGCCYGAPTDLPWAVACPADPRVMVHPAQLYETAATSLLALVLWRAWPRRRWDGQIIVWAGIGYGLWRFINEVLRGDHDIPRVWGLTPSQVTSLELVGAVALVAAWRWWRGRACG